MPFHNCIRYFGCPRVGAIVTLISLAWIAENTRMVKPTHNNTLTQGLIDREKLAARFCCSIESIKRMEKRGLLKRVQLGERLVRYRLSDIQNLEDNQKA